MREGDFWDWLSWGDSVDGLLDRGVLLGNSLDDLLKDSDLSDDRWSLFLWKGWKGSLQNVDLDDQLSDSSDNLVFSDNKLLVNLSDDWVQWLWSRGVVDNLLLEFDDSDGLLDVNNLLVNLSDDLLEFDDSLSEEWLLVLWDVWKFFSELLEGLSDDDNSLDQLGDFLLEDLDDLLFNLSERSWLGGWFSSTWLGWLGSVVDGVNGLLEDVNLLDVLLVDSLENGDLLEDDWSLVLWGLLVGLLKSDDSLVDLGDLLNVDSSLVNQFVDNSFFDLNERSLLVPDWSWLSNVLDDLGDLGDLVGDLLESLLQNVDLVNEGWSSLFWLLRKLLSKLLDSSLDDNNLVLK